MWHDGTMDGTGGWLLMGSFMLVFGAVIVAGAGWLLRGRGKRESPTVTDDARSIRDERFARSDVNEDEYRHRRDLLDAR